MKIPIDSVLKNPEQPRKEFDPTELASLAESIREHGLINPIAVEEAGDHFILIDGERRWRAACLAGLTEIEASVRPGLNGSGQVERLVLATVANIQRADMNPVEKAMAFQRIIDTGLSVGEVGRMTGLSSSSVTNYLLILRLPEEIQAFVREGKLSPGARSIRAILDITDSNVQLVIARAAAMKGMSEIEVLSLARRMQQGKWAGKQKKSKERDELSATWGGKWNMISQAGNPHISPELRVAAVETCKGCPLLGDASPKMCRDCPAVDLLKRVVGVCHGAEVSAG